jgi:hypothetical protein
MSDRSALQAAIAAEHAVVYGYGPVGAHLKGAARRYAAGRLTAHQNLRDRLAQLITAAGVTPAAAQPAYRLPFPVADAAAAKRLAAHLENGSAGAAWDLTAASAAQSEARDLAVTWLTDAAVAAAHWGAIPPLPGRPVG